MKKLNASTLKLITIIAIILTNVSQIFSQTDLYPNNVILSGYIRGGGPYNSLNINTGNGYIQIGPQSTSYAHIYTDRPSFLFNKPLYSTSGIISSLSAPLSFQTNGTNRMTINNSNGDVYIYSRLLMSYDKRLILGYGNSTNSRLELFSSNSFTHSYIDFKENLYFRTLEANLCPLALQNDGNVAIGFEPGYTPGLRQTQGNRLAVNGNVIVVGKLNAKEINVKLDVWSDFVFNKDYPLISLEDLEKNINEHRHLPGVPSEEEVLKNGINVGDMNAIMMQKIEELTLYVIEQNKKIKDLEKEIIELKCK